MIRNIRHHRHPGFPLLVGQERDDDVRGFVHVKHVEVFARFQERVQNGLFQGRHARVHGGI